MNNPTLFPPLRDEEYLALRADIEKRGVLVPIEVDGDTGEILDGNHRLRACEELGIRPPEIIRHFKTDTDRKEHAIVLNLLRRQLGDIAWANGFRKLCETKGVTLSPGARNDRTSANIAQVAASVGVKRRTAYDRMALADKVAPYPDLAEKVDSREMPAKRALRVVREREAAKRREQPAPPIILPSTIDLRHGDFRTCLSEVPDGSAQLVLTDPPYGKDWLDNWGDLGALAYRVLKPGGFLATYTGQLHLPLVLVRLLNSGLDYAWMMGIRHKGPKVIIHSRHIYSSWKPILVFSKGQYDLPNWVDDFLSGDGPEKDKHEWQQNEGEAATLIAAFSNPGDTVIDPCLGSGTVAAAAHKLGRSCLGCDQDAVALDTAKKRIADNG